MNLAPFRTLVAVSDHGSFAAAAEHLHVTPAAVSQQMKTLEEELQVALFDRSTRPPRLNAHGVFVAGQARDVLRRFEALIDAARAPDGIAGRLMLGCISGISSDLVPAALRNLRERYPGLQVRMAEGQSGDLVRRLLRHELDAAIITEPVVPEPELETLLITTERLLVIAPPGASAGSWLEAVRTLPFLRFNRTSGLGILIDTSLRRAGVAVREAMELDSSEALLNMVHAGLGVGVIPEGQLKGEAGAKVRRFLFCDPPVSRRVVLAEHLDAQRSDLSQVLYLELKRLTAERGSAISTEGK